MKKQLAIIRNVNFGYGDDGVALWFTVYVSESEVALIALGSSEAVQLLARHKIENVYMLDGKPCWVDTSEHGLIKFIDLAKI